MPLVKNTITGNNYLQKINTDSDTCSRTAIRSYNKQTGIQGYNVRTRFYLPFLYEPSSHTLWVFVNGNKAVAVQTPTATNEYEEVDNKTVVFGASLAESDVIEFIVAGSYLNDESVGGAGGGLTWILVDEGSSVLMDYGYMVNTSVVGPLTFLLPEAPLEGDTFAVVDAMGTFGTNPATLNVNSTTNSILGGTAGSNFIMDSDGMSLQLVFDGIDNWISVNNHDHNLLYNYEPNQHVPITVSTLDPVDGEDGDIWIKIA